MASFYSLTTEKNIAISWRQVWLLHSNEQKDTLGGHFRWMELLIK
uniref:Uncharacterized protein n=1 Tax=Anguilla anguilla TaxID=7936 RepID=A0A0E9QIE1_ANGAN